MKLINFRAIEIFSDGALHFSYKERKSPMQVCFFVKDVKNSSFFKKPTKTYSFQNVSRNSYKSKYKF